MTSGEQPPDVAELAQSMLLLHGVHDDEHTSRSDDDDVASWAKAPDFANDPQRAAAVHEATRRDRERYLTAGLAEVDCRFCHASVQVKKLGAPYTAVQWNTEASGERTVSTSVCRRRRTKARINCIHGLGKADIFGGQPRCVVRGQSDPHAVVHVAPVGVVVSAFR